MTDVLPYSKNKKEDWNSFVKSSKETTFFHQISWKRVLEESLNLEPHYFLAVENGEIRGILPLFRMNSSIWGDSLVSLPCSNYGGICAETSRTEKELLKKAKEYTTSMDVDYLQLRNLSEIKKLNYSDTENVTTVMKLDTDLDLQRRNLKKETRRRIRKAEDNNLEVSTELPLEDFFKIYRQTMKRLGSPHFSRDFFKSIRSHFPGNSRFTGIYKNGKPIAVDLLVTFKDTLYSLFAGSDEDYHHLLQNYLLIWKEIVFAVDSGLRYFDLGRSRKDTGALTFKKNWSKNQKTLYYQYILNTANKIPRRNPEAPPYKTLSTVWRYTPGIITDSLGPRIVKYLH